MDIVQFRISNWVQQISFEYSPRNGEFEYSLCNGVAIAAILAVV